MAAVYALTPAFGHPSPGGRGAGGEGSSSIQQLFGLCEHGIEHLMGQSAGLGVLLAGVVGADKGHPTIQGVGDQVAEFGKRFG